MPKINVTITMYRDVINKIYLHFGESPFKYKELKSLNLIDLSTHYRFISYGNVYDVIDKGKKNDATYKLKKSCIDYLNKLKCRGVNV